ncbi:MAG: glyoxylate/hydroxypyruvate reductase A [Rhodobacteraceae bacterium]|nr:glyoxylate/hydroxypyruvate reductase A [Paracoccaceae bacterium]
MTILLNNNGHDNETWRKEFVKQLPAFNVRLLSEIDAPDNVTYAMVWNHPKGDLLRYPNLKAIFSLGAGAENFIGDDALPDVPIVLLADPNVARDMAAHALYWVMDCHRRYPLYREQQASGIWLRASITATPDFSVGVLGLGRIGTEVAYQIARFGYKVSGWDLFEKSLDGISTVSGMASLNDFLSGNDVVINCLPLTPSTRHSLGDAEFGAMREGTYFINISRGAVVQDEALIRALNSGHLAGAALDAFATEPLPADSPYWTHPRVNITPHMSGATFASNAVKVIVENVKRVECGESPFPILDRARGY